MSLKFITRAFVTTSPQTREIYTLLGEDLKLNHSFDSPDIGCVKQSAIFLRM
jgi:hypothetical protein